MTLRYVGKTDKGHDVVAGCYRFMETYGMPFDIMFDNMKARGMIPSVPHLLEEAEKAGANVERIFERFKLAYHDVYEV